VICKIGLLGLGTVGTGIAKILLSPENRHPLLGEVEIQRIGVRNLNTKREVDFPPECFTTNLESIVTDPDIDLIVEVIGGLEPARSLILKAIARGKHVVTANKAVIARYGDEIFTAARSNGVYVMLEATVCGGIPIIQILKQGMGANRIQSVIGIINGTTNYILSRMLHEGGDFETILADAQQLGYAEADPSADIDGYDAADKIAILASLAFSDRIKLDRVHREGIRSISAADIQVATELGFVIKLLGIAQRNIQGNIQSNARSSSVDAEVFSEILDVRVHPTLIPKSHPLAQIDGVTNAVMIGGDPIGELVFAGAGAGAGATASAIVSDIINTVAAIDANPSQINLLMGCVHQQYAQMQPIEKTTSQFYVRFVVREQPGVIGELGTCFGKHQVSLKSVIQKSDNDGSLANVFVITQAVLEADFQSAIHEIRSLSSLHSVPTVLRLL
jgi:homoserine dehydrogenase